MVDGCKKKKSLLFNAISLIIILADARSRIVSRVNSTQINFLCKYDDILKRNKNRSETDEKKFNFRSIIIKSSFRSGLRCRNFELESSQWWERKRENFSFVFCAGWETFFLLYTYGVEEVDERFHTFYSCVVNMLRERSAFNCDLRFQISFLRLKKRSSDAPPCRLECPIQVFNLTDFYGMSTVLMWIRNWTRTFPSPEKRDSTRYTDFDTSLPPPPLSPGSSVLCCRYFQYV